MFEALLENLNQLAQVGLIRATAGHGYQHQLGKVGLYHLLRLSASPDDPIDGFFEVVAAEE
jgi:hypothetical protein